MRTVSEHNGNGSRRAAPPAPAGEVRKGGPFDLSEMERLANEMFRALPGAVLPGLAPDQLDPLPPPPQAEALRPPPGVIPSANGQVTDGAAPDVGAELASHVLDVAGLPRGAVQAPFGDSYYFLEEAPGVARAVALDAGPSASSEVSRSRHPGFDVDALRRDFPALSQRIHGHPLIWLDNGATTHKPVALSGDRRAAQGGAGRRQRAGDAGRV